MWAVGPPNDVSPRRSAAANTSAAVPARATAGSGDRDAGGLQRVTAGARRRLPGGNRRLRVRAAQVVARQVQAAERLLERPQHAVVAGRRVRQAAWHPQDERLGDVAPELRE